MRGLTGMSRRRVLLGAAAALATPSLARAVAPSGGGAGGGQGSAVDPGIAFNVQQRVNRFLSEFSVPGVSLAYGRGGALNFVAAYGAADPQTGEALTPQHRFRIASISKPLTATALMMLVERGRVSLQQPVFGPGGPLATWIPIDNGFPHADWLRAITIDHLLTHTAGGWTNDGNDPMYRYPTYGHADLIAATLREAPLINPPGSAYAYSNFGYCILGRVIEAASGQSYQQFVRSQLTGPAGAASLEVGGNSRAERRQGEVVYVGQGGDNPYGFNLARMDSHGGWIATAADLVKLGQRLNGDDPVPDLIAPQSINVMRSPSAASQSYGRGWAINPNHQNRWHAGALPGLVSSLILEAGGTVFAGLANTWTHDGRNSNTGLDQLLWDVHGMVYG